MAGLRQHWRVTGKLCPADRWHVGRGKRHCVSKHSQAKSSTPTPFHQTPHVSICVLFGCYVPAQMCVHIRDLRLCMSLMVCFFFVFTWSCLMLGISGVFLTRNTLESLKYCGLRHVMWWSFYHCLLPLADVLIMSSKWSVRPVKSYPVPVYEYW